MRLAVFSDIHGNPYATQAVLQAIAADGKFDHVVLAGDVCYGGSDPSRCVELVRAAGVQAVYGNTDLFLSQPDVPPPDEMHGKEWDLIQERSAWSRMRMDPAHLEWLAGLPFELRFSPTGDVKDDLLVVHANPNDVHDFIAPSEEIQMKALGKVHQTDEELARLLHGVQAAVLVFGHIHFTNDRVFNGLRLVNVSPCSLPTFDHDPRARYTVFTWQDGWRFERRYVEYDWQQEVDALLASEIPLKQKLAANFTG